MKTSLQHLVAGFFTIAMATLFLLGSAVAQTETGQITGRVLDPNGAAVAGASVTVKSVSTGAERAVTANDEGSYTVTNLQPGQYDVTAQGGSFAAATIRVEVSAGGKLSVDNRLGLQAVAGAVNVVAGEGGIQVNTSNQELANTISGKQLRELPTITRNPYALVGTSGNATDVDPSGRGTGFSINGQRSASTNILLDGGENVDNFTATVGQSVPLDSVQEFRVITSNFSAEYGRASGGIFAGRG
ncbi:MAG: carboxypeptidase regulatory-like domain-containing protein [Pyrinomonadaceae bacterium]